MYTNITTFLYCIHILPIICIHYLYTYFTTFLYCIQILPLFCIHLCVGLLPDFVRGSGWAPWAGLANVCSRKQNPGNFRFFAPCFCLPRRSQLKEPQVLSEGVSLIIYGNLHPKLPLKHYYMIS